MSADIRAGRAYVELGSKDSGFSKGLKAMQKRFKAFGAGLRDVGVKMFTGGGALSGAAVAYGEMGAHAERSSEKTGLSVESTSTLGYAAKSSGVDVEDLEKGVGKMSKTLTQAAEGSKTAQLSLARLGLTMGQLNNLSQEDRFKLIADKLSKIQDPAAKAGVAMEIFGRGGAEMLPLLNKGADGISDLQQIARQLGLEMSGKDAQGALEFSESLDDLWQVLQMLVFKIGAGVAPALQRMVDIGTQLAVAVGDWINQHRQLVEILFLVSAGVAGVGAVLVGLGVAITFVGGVLGGLATAFTFLSGVMVAIVSPIGLIVAGLVGAGVALWKFTSIGQSVGGYLSGVFAGLKADVLGAFAGITNAIKSGDWAKAAQIAWTMIKLEFDKGTIYIQESWLQIKAFASGLWTDIVADVQKIWSYGMEYLTNWDGVKTAAEKFMTWYLHAMRNTIDAVADVMSKQMVSNEAHQDTQAKYGGRTLTKNDTDTLAANAAQPQMDHLREQIIAQVRAQMPNASKKDQDAAIDEKIIAAKKELVDRLEKEYAKQYGGRQLSDDELDTLGDQEADYRVSSLNQQKQKREDSQQADYGAQQKSLDDDYHASHGDLVDTQEAIRAKAEADRQTAIAKQKSDLQEKLAALDKSNASVDKTKTPEVPVPPTLDPDKLNAGMDAAMKAGGGAAGTFNASAIAGMFGSGANTDRHLNTIATETTKASTLLSSILNTFKGAQPMRHT
jgi:hypothetical protein